MAITLDAESWRAEGRASLLGCSDGRHLWNPAGLGTVEAFDFLLGIRGRPFWHHADWDWNVLFADLDETALRDLMETGRAKWGHYDLTWIKGHCLGIRSGSLRFYSVDLAPWLPGSLEKECARFGVALPAIVREGKAERENIASWSEGRLRAYNRAELYTIAKLADRLFMTLSAHGLASDFPGQAAARLLRDWGAERWIA